MTETEGQPVSPPDAPAAVRPPYSFTAQDEHLFLDLSIKMRFVGFVVLGLALLLLLLTVVYWSKGHPVLDPSGVILLVVGGWTLAAARAFAKVAEAHGRDMTHILIALRDLRNMYAFLYWFAAVAIFLLILLIVLASVAS